MVTTTKGHAATPQPTCCWRAIRPSQTQSYAAWWPLVAEVLAHADHLVADHPEHE